MNILGDCEAPGVAEVDEKWYCGHLDTWDKMGGTVGLPVRRAKT